MFQRKVVINSETTHNMPIRKVSGGYKWGSKGKVYKSREGAVKQAQAAHANGFKEKGKYGAMKQH